MPGEDAARAAGLVAALLWVIPRCEPAPPGPCDRPAEAASRAGRTVAVACRSRPGAGGAAPLRGPARLLFGCPLDLNGADAGTLEALPGIGPVRARAIVAERTRRPFRTPDDLARVRGVGPHTVAGLRGRVVACSGPAGGSQICSPSLPKICENSYTGRAGAAGSDRGIPGGVPSCN